MFPLNNNASFAFIYALSSLSFPPWRHSVASSTPHRSFRLDEGFDVIFVMHGGRIWFLLGAPQKVTTGYGVYLSNGPTENLAGGVLFFFS